MRAKNLAKNTKGGACSPLLFDTVSKKLLLLFLCAGCLLGSFEGVDLKVFSLDLNFDVGCKVADTVGPLFSRCGVGAAYLTDGAADDPITAVTVFYDNLTGTFGEYTPAFCHKGTLGTGKYGLTLHSFILLKVTLFNRFKH